MSDVSPTVDGYAGSRGRPEWSSARSNAHAPASTLAVISRRIVSLVKEYYGKGPTHARTYHFGDVVLVLLRGGYTPVEKTLLADGYTQAVIAQRAAFQEVMQPRFKRVIEEELRREVTAFMSTMHHDPDLNAELFVLAPEAGEDLADDARVAAPAGAGKDGLPQVRLVPADGSEDVGAAVKPAA